MYFRYTLFKTSGSKVIESFGIGLNVSCIHHCAEILYELVRDPKSFDDFIQRLMANDGKLKFKDKLKYGEKAEIVLFLESDTNVSYSKSFSQRVEEAGISHLDEILKFSEYKGSFRCIYFDICTNQWYSRRCSNYQIEYDEFIDMPINFQQTLF